MHVRPLSPTSHSRPAPNKFDTTRATQNLEDQVVRVHHETLDQWLITHLESDERSIRSFLW